MSPASTTYLDMKYNPSTPIGLSWACRADCDWDRYYDWNPVQGGLTEDAVLGVEAPLWSETVRGVDQANFMAFPRMISVAEIGWTPQAARDVADFGARLAAIGGRLTVQGTNFYASPKASWTVDARGENQTVRRSEPLDGQVARFTAPAAGSANTVTVQIDDGTVRRWRR
jgi:hexosaminidase